MKYWEIIADNLSKADGVGAVSQRLIPTSEQSGLQTRIATRESVSLCVQMSSRIARNPWLPGRPGASPKRRFKFQKRSQLFVCRNNVFRRGERASAKKCLDIDYMLRVKRHPTEA
jgi:hypothetical protein